MLFQAFQADGLQVAGQLQVQPCGGHRVVVNNLIQGFPRRFRPERRPTRQTLVQDAAEGVDIGCRPDCLGLACCVSDKEDVSFLSL
jgi:hypothetical protein